MTEQERNDQGYSANWDVTNAAPHAAGVYLAVAGERYKIGSSRDCRERLRCVRPSARMLAMVHAPERIARKIERFIHQAYRRASIGGEWYEFDRDTLAEVLDLFSMDLALLCEAAGIRLNTPE